MLPNQYFTIFSEVGRVLQYGVDWKVYDFKALSDKVVKKQPGFKITEAKVLEVPSPPSKMTVKNFYAATGCQHSILKKGVKLRLLHAEESAPANQVKAVKKRDVLQLLQAMGQTAVTTVMNYYQSICEIPSSENDDSDCDNATQIYNEDMW